MYAVIEDSGQQFRVCEGDVLNVDLRDLAEDVGEIEFDRVLLVSGDGNVSVGTPVVAGAKVLAEIVGYGSSADAFRVTDQDPDGAGAAASMNAALDDAGLTPADIDYISAHGTGTKQNDQVETLGVKSVFGELAYKVPVSSVKGMLGHLIAAAGATELITCILAIRDQVIPPTINLHHPDADCDLDYVPNASRKAVVRTCMSNSFGFGGQNNTLILVGDKG